MLRAAGGGPTLAPRKSAVRPMGSQDAAFSQDPLDVPVPQAGGAAIYDPLRDRLVLFGQQETLGSPNDVWALYLGVIVAWEQLQPLGTPPDARQYPSAIYDPVRDRMLVHGGSSSTATWALSLSGELRWTQVATGGPARKQQTAIYDPVRDRMIIFGGKGGPGNDTWALSLSGTPTWSQLAVGAGTVPGRSDHAATYDPVRDRMIVWGGQGVGGNDPDATPWALSLSGAGTWSALTPSGTPPAARPDPQSAYDPVHDRIVYFGGYSSGNYLNEAWALNLAGSPRWELLVPAGVAPSGRLLTCGAYDPLRGRLLIFGGQARDPDNTHSYEFLNQTWTLSLGAAPQWTLLDPCFVNSSPMGSWTRLPDSPTPKGAAPAVYDAARNRLITFGGLDGTGNATWALNLSGTPAWEQIVVAGPSPSPRYRHSAIYDPVRDRMLVFGGKLNAELRDLWALNLSGPPQWTQLTPSGAGPLARAGASAVYDPVRDRMLVFGGDSVEHIVSWCGDTNNYYSYDRYNALNEVWALSLSGTPAWSLLATAGTPPEPRTDQSAVYDPVRDQLVVFGGDVIEMRYCYYCNYCEPPYRYDELVGDLWSLSLSGSPTWRELAPDACGPDPRAGAAFAYEPAGDRFLLFEGDIDDAWELHLDGVQDWRRLTGQGSQPSLRRFPAAAFATQEGKLVLFGGVDYFGYPGYRDAWTLAPAAPGSVPRISSPTNLPGGTKGIAYSVSLSAVGGTGGLSWLTDPHALPPGLALSASGNLSGNPTADGTFGFPVRVVDGAGASSARSYVVTIAPLLDIVTPGLLPEGHVTVPYSQALQGTAGKTPYTWSILSGSLPQGISLDASGLLSGTPPAIDSAVFTVQLRDAIGATVSRVMTLKVTALPLVIAAPVRLPAAEVGVADSAMFVAAGGVPPYAWSLPGAGVPGGFALSPTGRFFGIADSADSFTFAVRVVDAVAVAQEVLFGLRVVPHVKSLTSGMLPGVPIGDAYSLALGVSGGIPPYAWTKISGALPSGLVLDAAGSIHGQVVVRDSAAFTLQVRDSLGATASAACTLRTVVLPLAIVTSADLPAAIVGDAYELRLAPRGGIPPYHWDLFSGTPPAGISLNASGILQGSAVAAESAAFTVRLKDSEDSTRLASFRLASIIQPLVIVTPSAYPAIKHQDFSQQLVAGHGLPPYSWFLQSGALPEGLALSTSGRISGNPAATGLSHFTVGVLDAADSVVYRAYDMVVGSGLSIFVAGPNPLRPGALGEGYSTSFVATGGATPYVWSLGGGALPSGMVLNTGGALFGTPQVAGAFAFTVKVRDAAGTIETASYSLTVNPALFISTPGDLPGALAGAAYHAALLAGGGVPPYSWQASSGLPAWLHVSAAGQLTGTPPSSGDFDFQATVTDSGGITLSRTFTILVRAPGAMFAPRVFMGTGTNPSSVAAGDVNGDGRPDLVVSNFGGGPGNSISFYPGNGAGGFGAREDHTSPIGPFAVVIADLDGAGGLDLAVVARSATQVSVWLAGSGLSSPRNDYGVGLSPQGVAAGDLDGDGLADLAVTNTGSNSISLMLNSGDGTFSSSGSRATGTGPIGVVVGDFNGDGIADMIAADSAVNRVSVLRGLGGSAFAKKVDLPAGRGPRALALADLNGDGITDLVVADAACDSVAVLQGNGSGGFGAMLQYPTGMNPVAVSVADLDGDGKPDVATANMVSNSVSVLRGKGDGSLAPQVEFPVGSRPCGLAVADFDGSGALDLAICEYGSNAVSLLLNNGVVATPVLVSSLEAAVRPGSVAITWNSSGVRSGLFRVERADRAEGPYARLPGGEVMISATQIGYRYQDNSVEPGVEYFYRVGYQEGRTWSYAGPMRVVAGFLAFTLQQPLPNPSPETVRIGYSLAARGDVSLVAYAVDGHVVRELVRGVQPAGARELLWDGRGDNGSRVAAGLYFVRLTYNGMTLTRKIALIR